MSVQEITFKIFYCQLFKQINSLFNSISLKHRYIFEDKGITILAIDNDDKKSALSIFIPSNIILLRSTIPLPIHLEIKGSDISKSLDTFDKNETVNIRICTDNNSYKIQLNSDDNYGLSSAHSMDECEIILHEEVEKPFHSDKNKKFTQFLSSFKKKSNAMLLVGEESLSTVAEGDNDANVLSCFGVMTEDENLAISEWLKTRKGEVLRENFDVIQVNPHNQKLLQISKIDKHAPVNLYKVKGKSLLVESPASYLGLLRYSIIF